MADALILDMDGVISDTQVIHAAAESETLRTLFKISISPQEITRRFGGTSLRDMLSLLAQEHGIQPNLRETRRVFYENLFEMATGNIRPIPDTIQLIDRVHGIIPLAVASTSSHDFIDLVLESLQAKSKFDVIVSGQDVQNSKPEPDIFLLTADKLKKDPHVCVVIEDSIAGAIAAERAQMRCIVRAPRTAWDEYPMSAIKMEQLDSVTVDYFKHL